MLPQIKVTSSSVKATPVTNPFTINTDSIQDLFHDNQFFDSKNEIKRLQKVLNQNQLKLTVVYSKPGINNMNREQFCLFVKESTGLGPSPANEIFSCATNLFADESENSLESFGDDCDMTEEQFTTGVVRLANLYAMVNEGMVDTSKLASQTEMLLSKLVV